LLQRSGAVVGLVVSALGVLCPGQLWADEVLTDYRQAVGVGAFTSSASFDNNGAELDFAGLNFAYRVGVNDNLAIRALVFTGELDSGTTNDISLSGYGVEALFGMNMMGSGFRLYAGPGFVSEEWEFADNYSGDKDALNAENSRTISSFNVNFGAGFTLDRISVDVWASQRLGDKYSEVMTDIQAKVQELDSEGEPEVDDQGDPVYRDKVRQDVASMAINISLSYLF
jgi:hypothetical protein